MKILLKIFLCLLSFHLADAGQFRLYNTDVSNYPKIKSKFYALNDNFEPLLNLQASDFSVLENSVLNPVDSVYCQSIDIPGKISAVLVIDISTSMKGEKMESAKNAAKTWVNLMPNDGSETAVTGFAHYGVLINDFSQDKSQLLNSIDRIQPEGGTNFNIAFLDAATGAINLLKKAKNKPVIIFLTDGVGSGNKSEIIENAIQEGITVYTIAFGIEIPTIIKEIADETGGLYFSNLQTEKELNDAYSLINYFIRRDLECYVEWTVVGCATGRVAEVLLKPLELTQTIQYSTTTDKFAYFENESNLFNVFSSPFQANTIEVSAKNSFIDIDEIIINNSSFKVKNYFGNPPPLRLEQNQKWKFEVEYVPNDDGYVFATLEIIGSACNNNEVYLSGGRPSSSGSNSKIGIIEPIKGEIYSSGVDTLIRWKGANPSIVANIEFSSNNGVVWLPIGSTLGESELRVKYPNIQSNKCLVRITQLSTDAGGLLYTSNSDSSSLESIDWNLSGQHIAGGTANGNIYIIDANNGKYISNIKAHEGTVTGLSYSPDGVRLASVGEDSVFNVWNTNNGSNIFSIKLDGNLNAVHWSNNGDKICVGGGDTNLYVFRTNNYSLIKKLHLIYGKINSLRWDSKSFRIAIATDFEKVFVIDTTFWQLNNFWDAHTIKGALSVTSVDWSPQGDKIITTGVDKITRLWSFPDKELIKQYTNHLSIVNEARFHPFDNNLFASISTDKKLILYDISRDEIKYQFPSGNNLSCVSWSPDGTRIVAGTWGGNIGETFRAYSINKFPQLIDISDSTFSLVKTEIFGKDVSFGNVKIGKSNDIDHIDYFTYNGILPVRFDSVRITNDPLQQFQVIKSNTNNTITSTENINFLFAFEPKQIGNQIATLEFFTSIGKLTHSISGNGYSPDLMILNNNINFGTQKILTTKQIDTNIAIAKGLGNVVIDSVVLNDFEKDIFKFTNNSPSILNSEEFLNLNISFSPKEIKEYSALLLVYYNGLEEPEIVIMSGRGVNYEIQLPETIELLIDYCDDEEIYELKIVNPYPFDIIIDTLEINNSSFELINSSNDTINALSENTVQIKFKSNENQSSVLELIIKFDDEN